MKKIVIDPKYNENKKKYEIMFDFLSTMMNRCDVDELELQINDFVDGVGIFYDDLGISFSNDPCENIPGVPREFEELENFDGVGIYCDWYGTDSPLLLTYQEFYDNFVAYVNDKMKDKSEEQQARIRSCLGKFRKRYNI